MAARQERLFGKQGGPAPGSGLISRDQFVETTLATMKECLDRDEWPSREVCARAHGLSKQGFDRYRTTYYHVFENWRQAVRELEQQRALRPKPEAEQLPLEEPTPSVNGLDAAPTLFLFVEWTPVGFTVIHSPNAAACRITGYTRDELEGAAYEQLLRPGEPPNVVRRPELLRTLATLREHPGETTQFDTHWQSKTGQKIRLHARVTFDARVGWYAVYMQPLAEPVGLRDVLPAVLAASCTLILLCKDHSLRVIDMLVALHSLVG